MQRPQGPIPVSTAHPASPALCRQLGPRPLPSLRPARPGAVPPKPATEAPAHWRGQVGGCAPAATWETAGGLDSASAPVKLLSDTAELRNLWEGTIPTKSRQRQTDRERESVRESRARSAPCPVPGSPAMHAYRGTAANAGSHAGPLPSPLLTPARGGEAGPGLGAAEENAGAGGREDEEIRNSQSRAQPGPPPRGHSRGFSRALRAEGITRVWRDGDVASQMEVKVGDGVRWGPGLEAGRHRTAGRPSGQARHRTQGKGSHPGAVTSGAPGGLPSVK